MKRLMIGFIVGILCWAAAIGIAHAQLGKTVITEAHWVTDGLVLKLATGHTVKVIEKEKAKQMTWTPYETEIILQSPPTFDGWSIIHWTYAKNHAYDKDTKTKALFEVVFLGKD